MHLKTILDCPPLYGEYSGLICKVEQLTDWLQNKQTADQPGHLVWTSAAAGPAGQLWC